MKKFFEGISLSSIVAGTLAAVTSFLLASKIGIGGSVIGAAASYVVSAVATKIYQNVLTASGEKLQSASSSGSGITRTPRTAMPMAAPPERPAAGPTFGTSPIRRRA